MNLFNSLENIFIEMKWDLNDIQENLKYIEFEKHIKTKKDIYFFLEQNFDNCFESYYGSIEFELRDEEQVGIINDKIININNVKYLNDKSSEYYKTLHEYIDEAFKNNIDRDGIYISIKIDKDILINKILPKKGEDEIVLLFYSSENLYKFLKNKDIKYLDNRIKDNKIKIILNDQDNKIENSRFEIQQNIENIDNRLNDNSLYIQEQIDIITWRKQNISWDEGPDYITPEDFYLNIQDIKNENLKKLVVSILINLTIPYLSNYVLKNDCGYTCVFQNIQNDIERKIEILDKYTYCEKYENVYNEEHYEFVYSIFKWIYKDESLEKLSVVQTVASNVVCNKCNDNTYILFIKQAEDIKNVSGNNYKMILEKNVNTYFIKKENYLKFIEEKIEEINEKIDSLISALNNNLLVLIAMAFTASLSLFESNSVNILRIMIPAAIIYIIIYNIFFLSNIYLEKEDYIERYEFKIEEVKEEGDGYFISDSDEEDISKRLKRFKNYFYSYLFLFTSIIVILICVYIKLFCNFS